MRPTIALFGDRDSEQIQTLQQLITQEGGQACFCDIQLGGQGKPGVSYSQTAASWAGVDFAEIQAVHIRCTAPNTLPTLPPVLYARSHAEYTVQYLKEQEYQACAYGFFEVLGQQGKLVVNPLSAAYVDHNTKSQFYFKLRDWGYDVPDTLTTNDPHAAQAFINAKAQVIVKPAIGIGSARLICGADLQRLEEFRATPVLMQERMRGRVARVHIVAETVVLAMLIRNEYIDSRTATEGFDYYELPASECEKIVRATRQLGLHYAAWDVVVTEDGRHVYLDCNPGPYVMWIGSPFVEAVLCQLARFLLCFARTLSLAEAQAHVEPYRI